MRVTEPYIIFPRTLKSGRKVYYYQFRYSDGSRSAAKSCGTSKLSEARRYCQRLYNEGVFNTGSSVLFREFSNGFFDEGSDFCRWSEVSGKNVSKITISSYKNLLKNQCIPYLGNIQLCKISTDVIKAWIVWMSERWSAKTGNNAQSVLNIILKSAKEKKLIQEVPSLGISFRTIKRKERQLLTVEELRQIYRSDLWKWESARRAFLVCSITGMRIGEVVGLQSFEVEDDRINVEHSIHPQFGLGPTKTRTCRFVPIPRIMNLKAQCGSKWAFQKPASEDPVLAQYIYKHFLKICANIGIDTKSRGITVHSLRNMFISYMRGSSFGSSIDLKIKAVVGHSDKTMTDWYTYWTPEMFPEIYEVQEDLYLKITGAEK